jgi:hypothetical protein
MKKFHFPTRHSLIFMKIGKVEILDQTIDIFEGDEVGVTGLPTFYVPTLKKKLLTFSFFTGKNFNDFSFFREN